MNIVRWITFAWGCLAGLVMAYFAVQWSIQAHNPLRNELGFGFGTGLIYGLPAWIGLPVWAYLGRTGLDRFQLALLLSPFFLALAAFAAFAFLGLMEGL
jgi:hypothetical protein